MKTLILTLVSVGAIFAQSTTTTVPPSHIVGDYAPQPYSTAFPTWFVIPSTFSSCTFTAAGQVCQNWLVDPASLQVRVNGLTLSSLTPSWETITVGPEYQVYNFSTTLFVMISPTVFHSGDKVRVSFAWYQKQ